MISLSSQQLTEAWLEFRSRLTSSRVFLWYTGASVTYQVVTAACTFVVLRWLDPKAIGLWQSLVLIGTYSQLVQGGVIHGLNRELPFLMGREDLEAVEQFAGTGRIVALAAVALCLIGIVLSWIVFSLPHERLGATAVLVGTAASLYRLYLTATYRAARSFETLANIQIAECVLTVVSLPMVFVWGFSGYAIQFVVLKVSGTLLVNHFRPLKHVGQFRWEALKSLLVTGIPLFTFGYLSDVARSLPRLLLLGLGGITWVGMFAPANALMSALTMIPSAVGTYVYPQMSYRFGRSGNPSSLWPIARGVALGSLVGALPFALIGVVTIPLLLGRFFSAYAAGAHAAQWMAIAGVFMGASVAVNALASLKAYKWMFSFVVARLAFLLLVPWAGARIVGGLTGIAFGIALAYGLDFVAALAIVRLATRSSGGEMK